jgi:hypothetical protein
MRLKSIIKRYVLLIWWVLVLNSRWSLLLFADQYYIVVSLEYLRAVLSTPRIIY